LNKGYREKVKDYQHSCLPDWNKDMKRDAPFYA